MTKSKLSLLLVGVIAAAGIVFAGSNLLVASSGDHDGASGSSCESGVAAKTASACPASASCAAKTAGTASCPVSSCAKTAASPTGCAAKTASAGTHKECETTSSGTCAKPCGPKAAKTAGIETIQEREGARLVLVGHYACGYCDLGVSDACQPGFQTKDGKNYLLSRNNLSKELKAAAREADVEIVARVKKLDGAKYLEVEVVRHAS